MLGAVVKNPPANAEDIRDVGLMPGSGRSPWRRKWQPTPAFLPGKPHGQRSLEGYSPRGHTESYTTGQLNNETTVQFFSFINRKNEAL